MLITWLLFLTRWWLYSFNICIYLFLIFCCKFLFWTFSSETLALAANFRHPVPSCIGARAYIVRLPRWSGRSESYIFSFICQFVSNIFFISFLWNFEIYVQSMRISSGRRRSLRAARKSEQISMDQFELNLPEDYMKYLSSKEQVIKSSHLNFHACNWLRKNDLVKYLLYSSSE